MKLNSPTHSLNWRKELIFLNLYYARLPVLELFYNFSTEFCDVNKFKERELYRKSLYLALERIGRLYLTRKKSRWEQSVWKICNGSFTVDAGGIFPTERKKNLTKASAVYSKKSSDVHICYAHVAKRTPAVMLPRTILNAVAKASTDL